MSNINHVTVTVTRALRGLCDMRGISPVTRSHGHARARSSIYISIFKRYLYIYRGDRYGNQTKNGHVTISRTCEEGPPDGFWRWPHLPYQTNARSRWRCLKTPGNGILEADPHPTTQTAATSRQKRQFVRYQMICGRIIVRYRMMRALFPNEHNGVCHASR